MEILLIIFLLSILFLILFLIFKMIKWIFQKQVRIKWVFIAIGILIIGIVTEKLFFTKMEFIQSKAIPNLYIVKNPLENKDSLRNEIKRIVLKNVTNQIEKYKRTKQNDSVVDVIYTVDFYEYSKGSVFIPFGDAGTYYFIENEEDPGGFSVEVLDMYPKYHIAQFNLKFCKNDTTCYFGTIDYYKNWDIIKTDTIISEINENKL